MRGLFFVCMVMVVSTPLAFGHGLGIDTISSIVLDDMQYSASVEIPSYYEKTNERQLTILVDDLQAKQNATDVIVHLEMIHGGQTILDESFFASDGRVSASVVYSESPIQIDAEQNSQGVWSAQDINITGDVFGSEGLYTFDIQLEKDGILSDVYTADLTLVETAEFFQKDEQQNDVKFRTKSYFDSIDSFVYDYTTKTVSFEMPFDWSEKRMSHIPVVHEEVHFPKDFVEFARPSYVGYVNGIELFNSSINVDDYTEEDERIVHFVLLQDHLKHIKNQLKKQDVPLGDTMVFRLETSEEVVFPISAWTRDESFQIDLAWDPLEIAPNQNTKFIFTIRDGATGEPLRNSNVDFVIIQNGVQIHRESARAQVGGGFIDYTFGEEQTGPTIIRFEDIRGTGVSTEFGIVVAPEFGLVALVLIAGITSVVLFGRRYTLQSH